MSDHERALDLDRLEATAHRYGFVSRSGTHALIAEVRRLRAERVEAIEARDFAEAQVNEQCEELERHCSTCPEIERLKAENERLLYTSDKQSLGWKDRALKAEGERDQLRAALLTVEWFFGGDSESYCPSCGADWLPAGRAKHDIGCQVAAALAPPSSPSSDHEKPRP